MQLDHVFEVMTRQIESLSRETEELNRRLRNMVRIGTVKEIDAKKYRVRLSFGKGGAEGEEFLSKWVPWMEHAGPGGAQTQNGGQNQQGEGRGGERHIKTWFPPKVGQLMYLISPSGEIGNGFAMPIVYNDKNVKPSEKADEAVIDYDKSRLTIRKDKMTFKVGADRADDNSDDKLVTTLVLQPSKAVIRVGRPEQSNEQDGQGQPSGESDGVDNGLNSHHASTDRIGGADGSGDHGETPNDGQGAGTAFVVTRNRAHYRIGNNSEIDHKPDEIKFRIGGSSIVIRENSIRLQVGNSDIEILGDRIIHWSENITMGKKMWTGQDNRGARDGEKVVTEAGLAKQHWALPEG